MILLRGYLQTDGREGEFYREALALLDELESRQLLYVNWGCWPANVDEPERMARIQELVVVEVGARLAARAEPNVQYGDGDTPLHRSIYSYENLAMVEVLLAVGADPNAQIGGVDDGRTSLTYY